MGYESGEIKVTTGNGFTGYRVKSYEGLAFGEVVIPNGLLGALTTGTFYTIEALDKARRQAVEMLIADARKKSANAVIAIDIDINELSGHGVMVSANGTAVVIEQDIDDLAEQELLISKANVVPFFPQGVKLISGTHLHGLSLTIHGKDILKYSGVLCNMHITDVFNNQYTINDIGFTFSPKAEENIMHDIESDFVRCSIPPEVVRLAKSVDVEVVKYVFDDEVYSVEDSSLAEISKVKDEYIANSGAENYTEIFNAICNLPNSISIKKYLIEYLLEHPEAIDEPVMKEIERQAYTERLYGNRKDDTLKYLKEVWEL